MRMIVGAFQIAFPLTPALSPRRGRIFVRRSANLSTWKVRKPCFATPSPQGLPKGEGRGEGEEASEIACDLELRFRK
jgi:hypothetical protein